MTLNDKLLKASVVAITLKAKEARITLKPSGSNTIMWKNKLPFYINKNGNIKRADYENILDTLRECYGIDLTKEVKVNKSDIFNRNKYLKDRISDLKNADLSKELNKEGLEKYKKELATLKNRNTTYNLYELRKKSFDNKKLKKLLASFLIITGQVIYRKDKYEFSDLYGRYFKVLKPKSYDKDRSFFQKIFRKVFRIEAEDRRTIDKGLTESLIKNPNILKKTSIEYNLMYSSVMYNKIKKMASLINETDSKLILKSLYEYKEEVKEFYKQSDINYFKEGVEKVGESFKLRDEGKIKEANIILKKTINTKFLKLFKKNLDVNLKALAEMLAPYLIKPLIPYLAEPLSPHLVKHLIPLLTDSLTPEVVESLIPKLSEVITPELMEPLFPKLINIINPKVINTLVPKLTEKLKLFTKEYVDKLNNEYNGKIKELNNKWIKTTGELENVKEKLKKLEKEHKDLKDKYFMLLGKRRRYE